MLKALLFYGLGAVTPIVAIGCNHYMMVSKCAEVFNVYSCDAAMVYRPVVRR